MADVRVEDLLPAGTPVLTDIGYFVRVGGSPPDLQAALSVWANVFAGGVTAAGLITVASAAAFTVGPNGLTNPTFQVKTDVASAATGLLVTGNASGSGVTLAATGGPNEKIVVVPKGSGRFVLGNSSQSAVVMEYESSGGTGRIYSSLAGGNGLRIESNLELWDATQANLYFRSTSAIFGRWSANSSGMILADTSKLGIGVTPTYALHIAPTSGVTQLATLFCRDATPSTGKTGAFFVAGPGQSTDAILTVHDNANGVHRFGSTTMGFFGATMVVKQTSGAALTNSVTSGGTDDTIANYTDLSTYANDAAAIRNNLYQLARKVSQLNTGLQNYGLFT